MKRWLWLAAGITLLAGCGGGGSAAAPVAAPAGATQTASVSVEIDVPRQAAAGARSPQYVSAGTASVQVTAGALTATAPCVSPATVCTVSIAAPLGSNTFTVTLYDGATHVLATGTTVATVVANVLNTFSFTFNGVIAALTANLSAPAITPGAAASSTLTIVAKDAAGFTILQPGNYTNPIAITSSPTLPPAFTTSGALTITAIPAVSTTLTVNYDGTAPGASAIIFTAASGAVSAQATLTISTPGGVTVSPGTVQFTTVPASPQTVTIGETNYAGTLSKSAPGCGSVATIGALVSNHFNVTPLAHGTCTVTVSDTLGNSNTLTVNVATTSLTGS